MSCSSCHIDSSSSSSQTLFAVAVNPGLPLFPRLFSSCPSRKRGFTCPYRPYIEHERRRTEFGDMASPSRNACFVEDCLLVDIRYDLVSSRSHLVCSLPFHFVRPLPDPNSLHLGSFYLYLVNTLIPDIALRRTVFYTRCARMGGIN